MCILCSPLVVVQSAACGVSVLALYSVQVVTIGSVLKVWLYFLCNLRHGSLYGICNGFDVYTIFVTASTDFEVNATISNSVLL